MSRDNFTNPLLVHVSGDEERQADARFVRFEAFLTLMQLEKVDHIGGAIDQETTPQHLYKNTITGEYYFVHPDNIDGGTAFKMMHLPTKNENFVMMQWRNFIAVVQHPRLMQGAFIIIVLLYMFDIYRHTQGEKDPGLLKQGEVLQAGVCGHSQMGANDTTLCRYAEHAHKGMLYTLKFVSQATIVTSAGVWGFGTSILMSMLQSYGKYLTSMNSVIFVLSGLSGLAWLYYSACIPGVVVDEAFCLAFSAGKYLKGAEAFNPLISTVEAVMAGALCSSLLFWGGKDKEKCNESKAKKQAGMFANFKRNYLFIPYALHVGGNNVIPVASTVDTLSERVEALNERFPKRV